MDSFFKMVNVQSILFIYMLVGYFCRKTMMFDDITQNKLTDFTLKITLPCMVFDSFNMAFSVEAFMRGATALAIASAMAVVALIVGKLMYMPFNCREKSIMQYGTLVTNSGFAGLPVVSGAYGSEGLFLGSLFIIPTRILMWSAGISLFTQTGTKGRVKKVLLNPAIIAVELGILRMVTQLELPSFLNTAIGSMGDCTSPIAMALVGAILADVKPRAVFTPKAFYLVAVRQIMLPVICLLVLKALKIDELTTGVSVILTGMPIGATTAILAQKYGADARLASKCVFVSTLTSLFTVPALTLFI